MFLPKLLYILLLLRFGSFSGLQFAWTKRLFRKAHNCLFGSKLPAFDAAERDKFDLTCATILAGYSFEVYNEAEVGKPALGLDNTKLLFSSLQHIREAFSGTMLISLKRVKLKNVAEEQILELIATGTSPDPYAVVAVYEDYSQDPTKNHVIDSIRSSTLKNTNDGTWSSATATVRDGKMKNKSDNSIGENYALYVKDTANATIEFSIFDEELFSEDEFLGNAVLSLQELKSMIAQREAESGLEESQYRGDYDLQLPIYAEVNEKQHSLIPWRSNEITKRKRMGTLGVSVRYLPWSMLSNEQMRSLVFLGETSIDPAIQTQEKDILKENNEETGEDWLSFLTEAAQLLPWSKEKQPDTEIPAASDANNHTEESDKSPQDLLPKGASPLLADWSSLLSIILDPKDANKLPMIDFSKPPLTIGLSDSLRSGSLHQICAIDDAETDTQVSIWADLDSKRVVISFRGTETVKLKDIITDINLFQVPFRSDVQQLNETRVHQGFLNGYNAVQIALLQQLDALFTITRDREASNNESVSQEQQQPWQIYITGHSLGGALATLMAFDLARIKQGWYNTSSIHMLSESSNKESGKKMLEEKRRLLQGSINADQVQRLRIPRHIHFGTSLLVAEQDGALLFANSSSRPLMSTLQDVEVFVYTYGAPRVGNTHFKQLFNELVPHYYRVVNQQDVVARLPRTINADFAEYEHVGRTVLIDESYQPPPNVETKTGEHPAFVWVEGESIAECPLRDMSLFTAKNQSSEVGQEPAAEKKNMIDSMFPAVSERKPEEVENLLNSVMERIKQPEAAQELLKQLTGASDDASKAYEQARKALQQGLDDLKSGRSWSQVMETAEKIGVDRYFLEREITMLSSIWDMTALDHHMEPSYFVAMLKATGVDIKSTNSSSTILD